MITKTTLYEQVARDILDKIAAGVYRKGDMLPCEKELIQVTGVSRVTVREALRRLAEMGAIETYKGKGSIVIVDEGSLQNTEEVRSNTEKYRAEFMDSTRARLLIEPEIAKEAAATATAEDLEFLEQTLPSRGRYASRLMDDFHLTLAKATHNQQIQKLMETIVQAEAQFGSSEHFVLTVPEQQKAVMKEVAAQHRKIYEAVRDRNGEFASFYMKEHILYLTKRYEEYFNWILGEETQ